MAEIQVTQLAPDEPALAGHVDTVPDRLPAIRSTGLSRRTLVQGIVGSLAILLGALGSGGDLIQDPVIGTGPLSWVRYGHGRDLAQVVLYVGVGLLVWAWIRLGRDAIADRVRGRGVLIAAICWIAPMIISPPAFTRDVFSYLGQGELALHGYDPYAVGPNVLGDAIAQNVHPFWQGTPAPYGPMFILIAKYLAAVVGEHLIFGVILMRLVLLIGLVLLILAQPGLTRHLGGRLSVALWLVVANPIMVIHLVGGPHNDLLMIGLLAIGALLVLERRHVSGIALVSLGMAVKATAGVALPFLVWVWAARLEGSPRRRFIRAAAASFGVFAVVFGASTLLARVDFGWFGALRAPAMIVNWVNLPTGVGELAHTVVNWFGDLPEQPFINMTRFLGEVLLAVVAIRQWWLARGGGADAVRRMGLVLLAVSILAPPTLPWYLTWGLAVLAGAPWRKRWLSLTAAVAVLLLLVYFPNGEAAMYAVGYMAVVILFALLAGVSMVRVDPLGLRARFTGTAGTDPELTNVPPTTPLVDVPETAKDEAESVRV